MTHAGAIGMACTGAFLLAMIILVLARLRWVKWCPACDGNGWETYEGGAGPCTVCGGRGLLRVPDTAEALEYRDLDKASRQRAR